MKVGLATLATVSLAFGSVLAFNATAHAADIAVDPATEIAGYENGDEGTHEYNYDTWHMGSVDVQGADVTASLDFEEHSCGITFLDASESIDGAKKYTQLLKGFTPPEGQEGGGDRISGVENIRALIDTLATDATEGSFTYQLPIFTHTPGEEKPGFFTMVIFPNADGSITGDSTVNESGDSATNTTLDEMLAGMQADEDDQIGQTLIGVGLGGNEGTEVSWLSFGGDTYYFGDDCIEAPVEEEPEEKEEAPEQPTVPERVETAAFGG